MTIDPISDMLTRIRNANIVQKRIVTVINTKTHAKICEILKNEGFILDFTISKKSQRDLIILLKYSTIRSPIKPLKKISYITNLKRLSKPGLRYYLNYKEIPKILGGLGLIIISTSQGLVTDKEARALKIGGEPICSIW
uniref:ribosomal protein S8 n=1 Tax=Prototheca lentecrescens TaxID=2836214 RepID=UPI003001F5DF